METRNLQIGTPRLEQGESRDIGRLGSYCRIMVPPGTKSIPIMLTPISVNKRFASWGTHGRSSEEQNSTTAEIIYGRTFADFPAVPIQWIGAIPRTRQEPWDNFRAIQINRNGGLDQMEIGVVTRGEKFFLTAQLQFRGLIVPNGSTPIIVPALEHFSYPGFTGYNETWPGILPHIQTWETKWKVKPEGRSPKVKWSPGPNPFGNEGAAVLFFSPVGGTGRLLSARGVAHFLSSGELLEEEVLFLHFTGIEPGVNDQLGVEPMTWVRVEKIKPPRDGATLRQATHVAIN